MRSDNRQLLFAEGYVPAEVLVLMNLVDWPQDVSGRFEARWIQINVQWPCLSSLVFGLHLVCCKPVCFLWVSQN